MSTSLPTTHDTLGYNFIYFFGPDGSGKSTLRDLASIYLEKRGYRVWKSSVKVHHTLSYLLLRLIHPMNADFEIVNFYGSRFLTRRVIRGIWRFVEFLGLLPAIVCRVYLPILLGYVVICDRFIIDSLVTLSYFAQDRNLDSNRPFRFLLEMMPSKSLLIHLDAKTDILIRRKRDEPLTRELLDYYKEKYREVIDRTDWDVMEIDTGENSVDEVRRIVAEKLDVSSSSQMRSTMCL